MDEQMEISDKFRNEMHIVVPLSQVSKQGNKGPFGSVKNQGAGL